MKNSSQSSRKIIFATLFIVKAGEVEILFLHHPGFTRHPPAGPFVDSEKRNFLFG